jgi:hypothetical protein
MNARALRSLGRVAFLQTVLGLASIATVSADTECPRVRDPEGQNLFWKCKVESMDCGEEKKCKTVLHRGIVPYKTCECRKVAAGTGIGTGGGWHARLSSGDLTDGSTNRFDLEWASGDGVVIFHDESVSPDGEILEAQLLLDSADFTGMMQVTLGSGPSEEVPATLTGLNLSMGSFDHGGSATGTNAIALNGQPVAGTFDRTTGTLQFDGPVLCTLSNALWGSVALHWRPILALQEENLYNLHPTARLDPPGAVPVRHGTWGTLKSLYR